MLATCRAQQILKPKILAPDWLALLRHLLPVQIWDFWGVADCSRLDLYVLVQPNHIRNPWLPCDERPNPHFGLAIWLFDTKCNAPGSTWFINLYLAQQRSCIFRLSLSGEVHQFLDLINESLSFRALCDQFWWETSIERAANREIYEFQPLYACLVPLPVLNFPPLKAP